MVVTKVVIVGGGTAGWLTAGTLAAALKKRHKNPCKITLIESARSPTVGVGEGTWPTMRRTLKNMGVRETDFMRECNVAFKQGAKFSQWVTGEKEDSYYHPLMLPNQYDRNDIMHVCGVNSLSAGQQFSNTVCPQEGLCEAGLAPKQITTPEFDAIANYAYHLDAGKFSSFLTKHCCQELGVSRIVDDVVAINSAPSGDIASVTTHSNGVVEGDLFIDCTGFSALLLGQHLGVGFTSCSDTLFADSAIATQVSYSDEQVPVATHTCSTALTAGWVWDIGLVNRRGVGHVFSSQHLDEDRATQQLKQYVEATGGDSSTLNFKTLKFQSGHRKKFWHKNCIAIGLSAGFLEPLEASALLLVEISAMAVAQQFPSTRTEMDMIAKRFNQAFLYRWARIIDFLKLHYVLSRRQDSAFWRDNQCRESVSEQLNELLELWQYRPPCDEDFMHATEVFPVSSYQYVLYGMQYQAKISPYGVSGQNQRLAGQLAEQTLQQYKHMCTQLSEHRPLLNKIQRYGLQPV